MTTADGLRTRDASGALTWAAVFFALTVVVHNGDHLRRGTDLVSGDVFAAGTLGIFVEVGVVALVAWRHRLAPLAATVAGFSLAIGYVVVHFLPARSWLSDSFTSSASTSWMSWTAASGEIVGALALALTGLAALRAGADDQPGTMLVPGDDVVRAIAIAFAASQALTLVVSFAQRY
ncbi:MAG TPA: hypothetical protein VHD87_09285 [Acidimicrobiales bacterium]|nr:hypothetical protein [Acidimicrobiales bacterium]